MIFRDDQGVLKGAIVIPQVKSLSPRSMEALALVLHVAFRNLEIEGDAYFLMLCMMRVI